MARLEDWIDKTGWLSFFQFDDPDFSRGWGDQPHHEGFWVTARLLKQKPVPDGFVAGYKLRTIFPSEMVRHPRIDTPMNRDQLTPLIFPLHEWGFDTEWLVKKYTPIMWPHQYQHFKRSGDVKMNYGIRLFCDIFECIDSITDWFSNSESSQIKNIYRLVIADNRYPTVGIRLAKWLFTRRIDPWAVMTEYFTRGFSDKDNPPPVHLEWKEIIDEHFNMPNLSRIR